MSQEDRPERLQQHHHTWFRLSWTRLLTGFISAQPRPLLSLPVGPTHPGHAPRTIYRLFLLRQETTCHRSSDCFRADSNSAVTPAGSYTSQQLEHPRASQSIPEPPGASHLSLGHYTNIYWMNKRWRTCFHFLSNKQEVETPDHTTLSFCSAIKTKRHSYFYMMEIFYCKNETFHFIQQTHSNRKTKCFKLSPDVFLTFLLQSIMGCLLPELMKVPDQSLLWFLIRFTLVSVLVLVLVLVVVCVCVCVCQCWLGVCVAVKSSGVSSVTFRASLTRLCSSASSSVSPCVNRS